MNHILSTIKKITFCNTKTVISTEAGYFVILNSGKFQENVLSEFADIINCRDYLINVEYNNKTKVYKGWILNGLENVCPIYDLLFFDYNELNID